MDNQTELNKPPSLCEVVKKIVSEYDIEYNGSKVVFKLAAAAENMAIGILKNAAFYSQMTGDLSLSKETILSAIETNYLLMNTIPDQDTILKSADANNVTPLEVKPAFGVALPKYSLGNCNYQLVNPYKKRKTELSITLPHHSSYKLLLPSKKYRNTGIINHIMFKNAMQLQNIHDIPLKITITPRYGHPMKEPTGPPNYEPYVKETTVISK